MGMLEVVDVAGSRPCIPGVAGRGPAAEDELSRAKGPNFHGITLRLGPAVEEPLRHGGTHAESIIVVGVVRDEGYLDLRCINDNAAVRGDGVCFGLAGVLRGEHGKKRGEKDRGDPHA